MHVYVCLCLSNFILPCILNTIGPLREGTIESFTKIPSTDSQNVPLRSRSRTDSLNDGGSREDNRQVTANLWTDFQALAVKNVTAQNCSLVPPDVLYSYPVVPKGITSSSNVHPTRASFRGDVRSILDLGASSGLMQTVRSVNCDTTRQSISPGKG